MDIRLHVGMIGQVTAPATLVSMLNRCQQTYNSASNQDINLLPQAVTSLQGSSSVNSLPLHEAVRQLTKNNIHGSGPVTDIALLFAGMFAPGDPPDPKTGVFGLMFDKGFFDDTDPLDEPQPLYSTVPREGCAVFLDAIAGYRSQVTPPAGVSPYEQEVFFTLIHEIGHVFNLQHSSDPPSFLATSKPEAPYGASYQRFAPTQKELLAKCSSDLHIQPGGSNFEDLGLLTPGGANNSVMPTSTQNLTLVISCEHPEFYAWEPIELDVRLSVTDRKAIRRVRDVIDPGYDDCVIWIEAPTGERVRYRSTKRYCAVPRYQKVTWTTPFLRDISLFGQSGGYTFRQAGIHKVWIDLKLSKDRILRSNTLELNVLPLLKASAKEQARLQDLRLIGRELYYRHVFGRTRSRGRLEHIISEFERHWTGAACAYALGRACLRVGQQAKTKASRATNLADARNYLRKSLKLGGHRAAKAYELMQPLE